MQNESLIRAFDVCLLQVLSGSTPDQALEIYPQWQNELLQPLEAAQALNVYASKITVPTSAQSASRASFISAASSLRNRFSYTSAWRGRQRLITWLLIALLVTTALVGITAFTSGSLPDSKLYPIKELFRSASLMLASSPDQRLELEFSLDVQRLEDVQKLVRLGRSAAVSFPIGFQEMAGDQWNAQGLVFRITPETQIIGQVQPGFYMLINGSSSPDEVIEVRQVQPREYVLSGTLQRIDTEKALIAGIPVRITSNTIIHGAPEAGTQVLLHAFRQLDGQLSARLIELAGEGKK